MSNRPVPSLDPITVPADLIRPALAPPVQAWACCHCGTTGLTGDGDTCVYCRGLGLCHSGGE